MKTKQIIITSLLVASILFMLVIKKYIVAIGGLIILGKYLYKQKQKSIK